MLSSLSSLLLLNIT
jgi:hypothetical protein